MSALVKICGLKEAAHVSGAVDASADFIGFNFHPQSPRAVTVREARALAGLVRKPCRSVALFVDPKDADVDAVSDFVDIIQLHGKETPERIAEIQARTGKAIMKAVALASSDDVSTARRFAKVANFLLFDAKPSKPGDLEGGGGVPFDWRLLEGQKFDVPWLLAGGLTPENVAAAIARTGATAVDVSSGVEVQRGRKDLEKIKAFIRAAKS